MNRNERGTPHFGIGASNIVTRLGRDHPDVDIIGRLDLIKVDVELWKRYSVARRQVGRYVFGIDRRCSASGSAIIMMSASSAAAAILDRQTF